MIRAFLIINAMAMSALAATIVGFLPANDVTAMIVITVILSGLFSAVLAIGESVVMNDC